METDFLLAFGEEEFLAPLAMTGSEVFFNKLLNGISTQFWVTVLSEKAGATLG
jgi:hypothetical protein